MYSTVTLNLVVWTRYWTWVTFFFYIIMSVFVYIGYVWLSEILDLGMVRYSVAVTHESHLFWLTVLLIAGVTFLGDFLLENWRFEYRQNASDFARHLLNNKKFLSFNPNGK